MKKATSRQRKPVRKLRVVKKPKKSSAVPPIPEISKEMNDLYAAMKCIATAHNLLDGGLFKHTHAQAVMDSLLFLKSLHQQVRDQALAHPECDLIPELKGMKEQMLKDAEAAREASKPQEVPKEAGAENAG